jgi:hypothetical protein
MLIFFKNTRYNIFTRFHFIDILIYTEQLIKGNNFEDNLIFI